MTAVAAARRWRRAGIAVVLGLVVAVLAVVAWVGVRGWMAKNELDAAAELTGPLRQAVADRDVAAAAAAIDEVGAHARRAAHLTGDPVWRLSEAIPAIGANLAAVRVVAAQSDAVVRDAIGPLVAAGETFSSGARTADGAIDLEAVASLQEPLARARAVVDGAARQLGAIEPDDLIGPVREGTEQLSDVVAQLSPTLAAIDDTAALLPPLLGTGGPRTILVALQNNAELRTGGGITGSFVEVRADGGRLSLTAQADSTRFTRRDTDVIPVPASTATIYGDGVARFVQNASTAADFGLTGQLLSEWWRSATGTAPDAVLSVDPLVLRALLSASGAIHAGGQELSADNLVASLLVAPYMALDRNAQTTLFQETTAAVFSRLMSPDADLIALAGALAEPVAEGRVSLWSAHPAEQAIIDRTALAGPAARQQQAGEDAFAVYLNDATGAKMDSFLDVGIHWGVAQCRADGHRDVVVSVTLTSLAPADALSALPWDMTGGGFYGTKAGDISTNVAVSAPRGSFFGGVSVQGQPVPAADAEDAGFPVAATAVGLKPGESTTVDFRFVSAQARELAPVILHTPLLETPEIAEAPLACS